MTSPDGDLSVDKQEHQFEVKQSETSDMVASLDHYTWPSTPEQQMRLRQQTHEYEDLGEVGDLTEPSGDKEILAIAELGPRAELVGKQEDARGSLYATLIERCEIHPEVEWLGLADELIPDAHPDKAAVLDELGRAYCTLFEQLGERDNISKAVDCLTRAITLTPDGHPAKPGYLTNLGCTFRSLYEMCGRYNDIGMAVDCLARAVLLSPDDHPAKPLLLSNLAAAHCSRYSTLGRYDDISNTVTCLTQAIALAPDGHPFKYGMFCNLGSAYLLLFETFGRPDDISNAVECFTQALVLTPDGHPGKPKVLNSLGNSKATLFQTFGGHDNLSSAVDCFRQAVALTPDGHIDKPKWQGNLGSAYQLLYQTLGRHDDINSAVDYLTQALALTPDGHLHKSTLLDNLGAANKSLYDTFGRREDIASAVDYLTQAVVLTPDGHPDKPSRLKNLGTCYSLLFKSFGRHHDLNKAVDCYNLAFALIPDGHPDKPGCLNSLGNIYQSLFETFGRRDDISTAVNYHAQAVKLTAEGHLHKPTYLNNLGIAYSLMFNASNRQDDASRAVHCLTQAVTLTPDGHPDKPAQLNNLGNAYRSLFETSNRLDDISSAINCLRHAVTLVPENYPGKPAWLKSLSYAYRSLIMVLNQHDSANSVVDPSGQAISNFDFILEIFGQLLCIFRDAALMHTGSSSERLEASRKWARALSFFDPHSLDAYTRCMQLLSEAVWLGGSVYDRFMCLENHARDLVADAAAAAITMHKFDTAIEWLNQGRCMVWNQLLELRMPLDELRDAHPQAADELRRLSQLLEHSPLSSSDEATLDIAQQHRRAADQREKLIQDIRQLAGFESFCRPPTTAQLASYVRAHAVIVINVSSKRCDALVLQRDAQSADNIPLPDFSYQQAIDAHTELFDRLKTRDSERGVKKHRTKPEQSIEQVLATLWYNVAEPVLSYLGISEARPINELPHIVWCVTGALSFLPIHAVGDYTTGNPSTVMHNLVVSSYTPNLSILERLTGPAPPFSGMLAVGVSASVRHHAALPMVKHELDSVYRLFERAGCTRLDDAHARREAALQGMASHSWVHFACHGSQDREKPLESAFQLYDAELDLAAISRTRLPYADFAFLSACKTAAGDHDLPDEAVHLAAGLLMAGYRSVIASMWAIYDEHAPVVADKTYEYMLAGGVPDSSKAARALHKATTHLRELVGVGKYEVWVPYIHMGC